jgi:hypothetical protein
MVLRNGSKASGLSGVQGQRPWPYDESRSKPLGIRCPYGEAGGERLLCANAGRSSGVKRLES